MLFLALIRIEGTAKFINRFAIVPSCSTLKIEYADCARSISVPLAFNSCRLLGGSLRETSPEKRRCDGKMLINGDSAATNSWRQVSKIRAAAASKSRGGEFDNFFSGLNYVEILFFFPPMPLPG